MATRKISTRTSQSKRRAAARKAKARDKDGQIALDHQTLRELKAYAASTQFSANRAIMRAAIRTIEAQGVDQDDPVCRVMFSLKT